MPKRKPAKRGWTKPSGMSKKMAEEVLAGKICGARKKKCAGTEDSHFCRQSPTPNSREQRPHPPYRCRLHTGSTKESDRGFKPNNKISLKHGIYSDAMEPDEKEIYEDMLKGGIEQEITICRMRLRRALIMELRQKRMVEKGKTGDEELKENSHLKETSKKTIEETVSGGKDGKDGEKGKVIKSRIETAEVRMNVNYSAAVKDISNELYKYFQIQALQSQQGSNMSASDSAKRVQEEIRKIEASIEEIEVAVEGAAVVTAPPEKITLPPGIAAPDIEPEA